MERFKLYVREILTPVDKGVYGIETDIVRFNKNFDLIFSPVDADFLRNAANNNSEGISYMQNFCQFVIYIRLQRGLKIGSMAFFDCNNDVDIALDAHNMFTKQGWSKQTKEEFMKQFMIVSDKYHLVQDLAELTTEEF